MTAVSVAPAHRRQWLTLVSVCPYKPSAIPGPLFPWATAPGCGGFEIESSASLTPRSPVPLSSLGEFTGSHGCDRPARLLKPSGPDEPVGELRKVSRLTVENSTASPQKRELPRGPDMPRLGAYPELKAGTPQAPAPRGHCSPTHDGLRWEPPEGPRLDGWRNNPRWVPSGTAPTSKRKGILALATMWASRGHDAK